MHQFAFVQKCPSLKSTALPPPPVNDYFTLSGEKVNMSTAPNALGRESRPGKPFSTEIRGQIVDLYWIGVGPRAISWTVRVTHGGVCRIIRPYQTNGTYSPFSQGGRRNPSRLSDNVLESVELFTLMKPSMFGGEIRERLLNVGVCDRGNLPVLSTLNKGIKNKLRLQLLYYYYYYYYYYYPLFTSITTC